MSTITPEQLWHQSGDEPFIAGLLQDIGILVLLRELGEPYAKFLTGVIDEKCDLASLEQDTLGFDHNQLSAALLAQWQLPARLVELTSLLLTSLAVSIATRALGVLPVFAFAVLPAATGMLAAQRLRWVLVWATAAGAIAGAGGCRWSHCRPVRSGRWRPTPISIRTSCSS